MSTTKTRETTTTKSLSSMVGRLGVDEIRVGKRVLKAIKPKTSARLSGHGDTIRPGDVVEIYTSMNGTTWCDSYPVRILEIQPEGRKGASILHRQIDEGPLSCRRKSATSSFVPKDGTFDRRFKKLSQGQVDTWFHQTKNLPEGWIDLPAHTGKVLIENGIPVKIQRSSTYQSIQEVIEIAGTLSGYDISAHRKYDDTEKITVSVKAVFRVEPPKVRRAPEVLNQK